VCDTIAEVRLTAPTLAFSARAANPRLTAAATSKAPQQHILPDCDWQHITFTMPYLLWPFFNHN
jgi:hypothetical protein